MHLALLATLACACPITLQDDPAALIEKLRSESIEVREAATKRLKELGKAARPALEKAAKDPDGELAARAAFLLRILQLRDELSTNLQKAMPDAVERLALGKGAEWTAVFLEATATDDQGNRKFQAIVRGDLIPLAANAIRGAEKSDEKLKANWEACNWRLRSALPEMQKLLRDPDAQVRQLALVWYVVLGGREVAGQVAELLKDGNVQVRQHAANHLGYIGTKAQVGELQAALKDPDPTVQLNAARALGKLGDRTAVDSILPFLDTKLLGDAAMALGELGCNEHAEKIAALLKDDESRWYALIALDLLDARDRAETIAKYLDVGGPGTPGHAAMVLASWKIRAYSDKIAAMVKDKIPGDYGLAIMAVGRMGDARHAKTLVPMLKDDSNYMRADAAEALELLDARDCAGDLASLLKDGDAHARSHGALALGKLASRMPESDRKAWIEALRPLEKDPSEAVRFAASISLVRLGVKSRAEVLDLVRRLDSTWFESWRVMAGECTLALTQAHENAGYEKLMREIELKRAIESPDSLASALGDAGLKLVNREELILKGMMGTGRVIRSLDLLDTMLATLSGVIVEKDTVRVVPRDAALEYWAKRLQGK
ncbi:MAG TPA: HEAT repeat domain-containing protein [Planctomycetota bacterium]|nr:HEAT repeat domain-containing protein [Planctomycetota bacterium]